MKLVAVSVVKNEADIIEAFVRHTRAWTDHHLVFDHDSTDGTREILYALQREGLPLSLFTDDAIGNLQQARSNFLTRRAGDGGAEWVLPLDADEILAGPGRAALEQALSGHDRRAPATLPLHNYYPTVEDDATLLNPVLRLSHCQRAPGATRKIIVPRELALDPTVYAGKGSHALYRAEQPLPDRPLPPEFRLAHLALRTPGQQAMRVLLGELQKLSRGRAHAGLDLHYRLGFQLLAQDPEVFFRTVNQPADQLTRQPVPYAGGPLRYPSETRDANRLARALVPYLEKLARQHGALLDQVGGPADQLATPAPIRELASDSALPLLLAGRPGAFAGFTPREGWGPAEGPLPEAFLPAFNWGYAPRSVLAVTAAAPRPAELTIEALTYSETQAMEISLNGALLREFVFPSVNQREVIRCSLALRSGENDLEFRYRQCITSERDPRQLAVIFLSVRIE